MALLLLPFTLALWQGNTQAQQPGSAEAPGGAAAEVTPRAHALFERQTLTDDWLGFGKHLASAGVKIQLDLTQVYQVNLRGGISTHRHSGRYAGSYDLGLALDLEKLLNVAGAAIFAKAKGSWSDGLDASCVGSAVGDVNDDASGDYSIYLARLYYQQSLLEGRLRLRVGKLKLTGGFECRHRPGAFDGNAYANDETCQFLNSALVNNPTIPFPKDGLGMFVHLEPLEWWYLSAAVADAQADKRETGFNTAFHGPDHFFSIFEMGFAPHVPSPNGPLAGMYRVGFWYDPQDKDKHGGGTKRDDTGLYLSLDQMLWREPAGDGGKADQGLGAFVRYGLADDAVSDISSFWSAGVQYKGLLPTRDEDVLAAGFALGRLVAAAGYDRSCESAIEVYYNARITPWLSLSPSFQYVRNPGGVDGVHGAYVVGCRLQMRF